MPQLLVCHDMAGGYHEDAWAQGCQCSNPFYISHWHLIGTFIYFSHSFVTIPPPGWINAAHQHDVLVKLAPRHLSHHRSHMTTEQ